jgi:hypothetical protein
MHHVRERDSALAAIVPPPEPLPYVYFDPPGAAKRLGISPRTLETLRSVGGGPRYLRLGRVCRYRSDWLDAWAETNAVASTSEETARRRI